MRECPAAVLKQPMLLAGCLLQAFRLRALVQELDCFTLSFASFHAGASQRARKKIKPPSLAELPKEQPDHAESQQPDVGINVKHSIASHFPGQRDAQQNRDSTKSAQAAPVAMDSAQHHESKVCPEHQSDANSTMRAHVCMP